jgi:hypothetical protein
MPTCPICQKSFALTRFLENHLTAAASCRHTLDVRYAQPPAPDFPHVDDLSDTDDDPDFDADIFMNYEDLDTIAELGPPPQENSRATPPPNSNNLPASGFHDGPAHANAEQAFNKPPTVKHVYAGAGTMLGYDPDAYQKYYEAKCADPSTNVFEPFASKLDWEFAQWVKTSAVGDTALTNLLKIPQVCATGHLHGSGPTHGFHRLSPDWGSRIIILAA